MNDNIDEVSDFEIAMNRLDKIADQLQKRIINKNDFDTERLIILIDLIINYDKVAMKADSK